jgi:hypothetical protein
VAGQLLVLATLYIIFELLAATGGRSSASASRSLNVEDAHGALRRVIAIRTWSCSPSASCSAGYGKNRRRPSARSRIARMLPSARARTPVWEGAPALIAAMSTRLVDRGSVARHSA